MRYIYYPEINLEELYDHAIDSHEWTNVAYQKDYQAAREEHRMELLRMLPDLTWSEDLPAGYTIDSAGHIRKSDFQVLKK